VYNPCPHPGESVAIPGNNGVAGDSKSPLTSCAFKEMLNVKQDTKSKIFFINYFFCYTKLTILWKIKK
jgi:hypothetical protein